MTEELLPPYFLEFLPEKGFVGGWSSGLPYQVLCPICRYDYVHMSDPITLSSDSYTAWHGRGDAIKIPFDGECGHRFALCFGYHKGQVFAFWEYAG